jgi:hypothetical protein
MMSRRTSGIARTLLERRIRRLTERVEAGSAPIIWIRGIAGSGKTRLLRQLE